MNTKALRIFSVLVFLGVTLGSMFAPVSVNADAPADILDAYTIAITPQIDGTLVMNYALQNYCTYSDWPSDQPYLQIGVPNGNFSISDWGPRDGAHKVVNAEPVSGKFVQLDFDRGNLPKNGDCFDLYFSIVQNRMAYPDPENGNITFKFIPAGWTFPIQVKLLTVMWVMPSDSALLKLTDPNPMGTDGANMIWQWANPAMNSASMFSGATIKLAYDQSAFQLSEAATTKQEDGGDTLDLSICWTIFWIVVVIIIVFFIIAVITEAYESGDGIGPAFVTVIDNTGEAMDDFMSSAGGSGGSSGHSSGCACAGCACACACAGGGKVGCSRKAIGISCLTKVINEMAKVIPEKEE